VTGLELVTVGRVSVDLYASTPHVGFDEVDGFVTSVGGSPTNVAVAAARLGHHSAVLTRVGADPFGAFVRTRLRRLGVDTAYVGVHPSARTTLSFAVLDPPEEPPLHFYRDDDAPELAVTAADLDDATVAGVPVLWLSGAALCGEPSASATLGFAARRARDDWTVVDLDYRPSFWPSAAAAGSATAELVSRCSVAVGNLAECRTVVGSDDPDTAADRLLERGVRLAVVKLGPAGVLVASAGDRRRVPAWPVPVVCALGAGDAFGGALVHGLLAGWDAATCVEFANAAGAIVASRLLCADAMPSVAEVTAQLEGSVVPH
jgi:5-dehydro-2-deoxygluconokinase